MSDALKLNCLVLGDPLAKMLTVQVTRHDRISAVLIDIKNEYQNQELRALLMPELFYIALPDDELAKLIHPPNTPCLPLDKYVDDYWPGEIDNRLTHILVVPKGKCAGFFHPFLSKFATRIPRARCLAVATVSSAPASRCVRRRCSSGSS